MRALLRTSYLQAMPGIADHYPKLPVRNRRGMEVIQPQGKAKARILLCFDENSNRWLRSSLRGWQTVPVV